MQANRLGAREAAAKIERGELTAEALARACLERIEAREADVRAWAFVDREQVLRQARGPVRGPMQGVPVGVKDIFDTHDLPTEHGCPEIYRGHRPAADAAAVALTRRAGGSLLGKTVTCQFATMVPSATRNPHDLRRTPGGSSSGSAAAVADFMVPLAFGTQTAGSIIRPASYCGVAAWKPTYSLLPRAGVKPDAESLDTVGTFARSVDDLRFFARALTGIEALESATVDAPRIAFCRTHEWDRVQPEMASLLESAARALGAPEVVLPASFAGLRAAHTAILWYEVARSLADEYTRFPERMDARLRERCARGFAMDTAEYVAARALAERCRRELDSVFAGYDALLLPAATGEAPLGLDSTGDVSMNVVWTLLHGPLVCVPASSGPNGLPLGLQVAGRIGDDARTLACAAWAEAQIRETP